MPLRILGTTTADRDRLVAVHGAAFFFDPDTVAAEVRTASLDWSRTFAASPDGGTTLAGVYTSYDMAVTVPGPLGTLVRVPMPGLSWVSVHPDHRRRGVLREMVTHHLADLRDQGAALSGLHAAEVAIYGRFGYAAASAGVDLTLPRGTLFDAPGLEEAAAAVRTHYVEADSDETAAAVQELHLRCATTTLGAVTRTDRLTRYRLVDQPRSRQGRETAKVLFASVDGQQTGYAIFHRQGSWGEDGLPGATVTVPEIAAADPASLLTLARRLVDFDLTTTTRIDGRMTDDPLIWWAGGPRSVRTTTHDGLWLRLVDVGAALSQRGYASACDVVLDVADDACPWNHRRWRLTAGHDGLGRCVPTEDPADLRLPVQALAAAYLGTRTLSSQAREGSVQERTPGALWAASHALSDDREPVGAVMF
jgi:predicted acetyltransferase